MTLAEYIHADDTQADGALSNDTRFATRHSPTSALVVDTLWVVTLADDNRGIYYHGRHTRTSFTGMIFANYLHT
jgi:uncharacterized protein (DUF2342 family)